jgi:hypothetical protein
MWSEEELREIEPEPPARRTGSRSYAGGLRAEVSRRNAGRARERVDELTRGASPSVIYAPGEAGHGNFIDASYRRILANPAWAARLEKAHTAKRQARPNGADEEVRAWRELDTATSSDALLMNIFCYPRVFASGKLASLLGVDRAVRPEFGVRSLAPLSGGHVNTTEIDMRLGDLLVEAKLTEADFQVAPMSLVERCVGFDEVFDQERLQITRRGVRSYQLIRGVLAAVTAEARFAVFCDARRPDLVAAWYEVIAAVRRFELQSRLRLVTWQEIAACVPKPLQRYLGMRYGV